jgi:DNA-binding beta-propeller fold protein YncE
VAVAPNGRVAIALNRENSVSVIQISGSGGSESRVFNLGSTPVAVAISRDSSFAVVVTDNPIALTFIRGLPDNPTASPPVTLPRNPSGAQDIALTPSGDTGVITATNVGGVLVVDGLRSGAPTVRQTVRTGPSPSGVAVTPDGNGAFVVDMRNNNIAIITGIAAGGQPSLAGMVTVGLGLSPRAIALSPDGSLAVVTNQDTNNVSIFRILGTTFLLVVQVPVGSQPAGVSISSDGDTAIVANVGDRSVSVITSLRIAPLLTSTIGPSPNLTTEPAEQSLAFVP